MKNDILTAARQAEQERGAAIDDDMTPARYSISVLIADG